MIQRRRRRHCCYLGYSWGCWDCSSGYKEDSRHRRLLLGLRLASHPVVRTADLVGHLRPWLGKEHFMLAPRGPCTITVLYLVHRFP